MSDIKTLKRECLSDIRQFRDIIRHMENYIHTGDLKKLIMVEAFFKILTHHLHEGDLTSEAIDLALNIRLNEFLHRQGKQT